MATSTSTSTAGDYFVIATAAGNQAARAFWTRASAQAEPGARAASGPSVAFEGALDPEAQAVLARLAKDALGRFTLQAAALTWLLACYRRVERLALRTPGLREDGDGAGDVPLWVCARAGMSVREYLRQYAQTVADSYTHRHFPVDELLRAERGIDPQSVADILLFDSELHRRPSPERAYAWSFELKPGGLSGRAPAGQFPPRLVAHFSGLLAMFGQPDRRLDTLVPLAPGEAAEIRALAEGAPVEPPADVLARFQAQAALTPAAVALEGGGRALSYRELNAAANRLAQALRRRHGVGPESRVVVAMPRSEWAVIAILGVLKAGGAYVPIELDLPTERRRVLFEDSRPAVLLTLAENLIDLDAGGAPVLALDVQLDEFDLPATDPDWECPPDSLAYVLHTSGSSGRPKGCGLSRRSLAHYLDWACAAYLRAPRPPQALLFTSLAFDLTVTTLFGPLLCGGRLRVAESDQVAAALAHVFDPRSPVDFIKLTPSHIDLVAGLRPGAVRKPGVTVVVGGESLLPRHLETLHARLEAPRIFNEYGPTEACVGCIVSAPAQPGQVDIGRPIAGSAAYLLGEQGELVPLGAVGEICVAGPGVARGYLERPDLTAARFVPHPFGAGERLYRTGDLGRLDHEGRLECLGRSDRQLKLRGLRIEPGEIEQALEAHPQVLQAHVLARADGGGEPRLVAYLVSQQAPDAAALRRFLAPALPEALIPQAFVALAAWPLDAHGKLDLRALPAPSAAGAGAGEAPRTPLERELAAIWGEVLGLAQVGRDDDFFALGGHSLAASRVVVRVAAQLGAEIEVGALFEAPTLARLAPLVESAPRRARGPAPAAAEDEPAPLSHQQERLWLLQELEGPRAAYNIGLALRLRGRLDADALERSLARLARRQSALRTTFEPRDGSAVQRLRADGPALERRDLTSTPADEIEATVERLAAERVESPFDLRAAPPVRLELLALGPEEHVLLGTLHHVVFDEWSAGVFVRELSELYAADLEGREARLPPLACDYAEYARRQRAALDEAALQAQLDYWRRRLAGAPASLPLAAGRPPAGARSGRAQRHRFTLPADLADGLRAQGRRHGVTLFMTLLAGFDLLLAQLGAGDDVVVGTSVAGRATAEAEDLVGFFVNQLVLRSDLSGDPTWADLLARVRATTLDAWRHQDLPFHRLVAALNPPREAGRSPLFQVKLVFQNVPAAPPRLPGLELELLDLGDSEAGKFDLLLVAEESPEGIAATFQYASDLFDAARVARLAWLLEVALRLAVERPQARLSELRAALTQAEREHDQARAALSHAHGAQGLRRARRVADGGGTGA